MGSVRRRGGPGCGRVVSPLLQRVCVKAHGTGSGSAFQNVACECRTTAPICCLLADACLPAVRCCLLCDAACWPMLCLLCCGLPAMAWRGLPACWPTIPPHSY